MKTNKGFTPACDAQCKKLQDGLCKRLTVDEIQTLLDRTDWDDLDKGEIITPYLVDIIETENDEELEITVFKGSSVGFSSFIDNTIEEIAKQFEVPVNVLTGDIKSEEIK